MNQNDPCHLATIGPKQALLLPFFFLQILYKEKERGGGRRREDRNKTLDPMYLRPFFLLPPIDCEIFWLSHRPGLLLLLLLL
jgi:hypothetical protein